MRKFQKELKGNPLLGDPLKVPYVREKKLSGKRAYFVVNDMVKGVLFVATSYKKDQSATIDYIFKQFEEFNYIIKNLVGNT